MRLLLIRHAAALPHGTPGIPDDERPLTPEGVRKFRLAARGLARLERRPDAILTSPLPRARRTAEIAAAAWGRKRARDEPALAAGRFEAWDHALARFAAGDHIALVGHEPHLSAFLARLLGHARGERLAFRKGAVAIVEVDGAPKAGGRLVAFLAPRALRALAER